MAGDVKSGSAYRVGTRTDVGRRRAKNEDFFSVNETRHGLLLIVCDGMGGHAGGERASRLAVQTFIESFEAGEGDPRVLFEFAVERANESIHRESTATPEYAGMGTTLVAALVKDGRAMVVNVGDSRAYRWHARNLERISNDHSVVEELVAAGRITPEQARVHPQRNLITRALGTTARVEADFFQTDIGPGDALLLASDGLTGMITDEDIAQILRSHASPDAACDALVQAALDAGGDDNVTVAFVRSGDDAAAAAGPVTDPNANTAVIERRGTGGSTWLWLTLALVAGVAAWLLFVARPWEHAGNLAPRDSSPPISVDTSLSGLDSIALDSTGQSTPFDQLRSGDTFRNRSRSDTITIRDTAHMLDTLPAFDAVTGRRR
ncbi:MAG: Stp1/IreP family PP2C-type Ser/Thr phosphatase [bacterium]|nr:Stp1/IreP family PP2C-type Ser/Thr phosphatase [Candidatus Kapabacteria bacterium]